MKNLKNFVELNEEYKFTSTSEFSFLMFVDYKGMKISDFKSNWKDVLDNEPGLLKYIQDLWSKSNIEFTMAGEDMYPSSDKLKATPKYSNIYVFSYDIGAPTLYIISSDYPDLLKKIPSPEEM